MSFIQYVPGLGVCIGAPNISGLDYALSMIFTMFRIYREAGTVSRLYVMSDGTTAKIPDPNNPTATNNPTAMVDVVVVPSCELKYAGRVTSEIAYDSLVTGEDMALLLMTMYKNHIQNLPKKTSIPEFKTWWARSFERWVVSGSGLIDQEPSPISFDPCEFTLIYVDHTRIVPGSHPNFDSFLSQATPHDQEVIKAWLWGCFVPENQGRQVLYFYDEGKTGKSALANAIFHTLKSMSGSLSFKTLSTQFGYSSVYGKRLLVYPDCKHENILRSEILHTITGGDYAQIEYKGLGAFTARVYAHVMVMSNDPPQIDTYRPHEKTRLIPIHLDATKCTSRAHYDADGHFVGNNAFETGLKNEMWNFLWDCQQSYSSLCPMDREIIVHNDAVYDDSASNEEDRFEEWFGGHFEISEGSKVFQNEMFSLVCDISGLKAGSKEITFLYKDWKYFLMNVKKIPIGREWNGNRRRYFNNLKVKTLSSMIQRQGVVDAIENIF